MSNLDSAAQNVRFNLDAQQLEFALGLDWIAVPSSGGGTPGGSDTQVQFNDDGDFGGDSKLVFDKTTGDLSLGDDQKLIFGQSDEAWIKYNADYTAFHINTVDGGAAQIAADHAINISANGEDGGGPFDPTISLQTDGGIQMSSSGGANPAVLSFFGTTKGFLPPKLNTTQRDAISGPVEGLMVFNTSTHTLNYYDGSTWQEVAIV